ncbi:27789_t:CDS:1, partial [Racocetra persica]
DKENKLESSILFSINNIVQEELPEECEDSDIFFNQLIITTQKMLDILKEHKNTKNIK